MAKKVIITGTGFLTSLSDDWGGVNEGSSAVVIYGTTVPANAEWGVNRGEIERFLKSQFGTKIGAYIWEQNDSYYDLVSFATSADRALYESDPETYASLVLVRKRLPISSITSDSYICRLTGDVSTSNSYVIRNGDSFEVKLRYQSIYVEGATSTMSNYNADGTIIIERSVNAGSTWVQVARLTGITSADPTSTAFPVEVNLGEYAVASMNNRFRIRASYQYVEGGVTKTRYSSYVTYSVSAVNLALEMATDWQTAITANASTTSMALNFTLYGAVQKYLTIKVDGTTFIDGSPYSASVNNEQTGNISIVDSTKAIFTHGLHEVQAFLTCNDGAGGTIESDVMIYHLMVYNADTSGADLTKPYLMLQEVAETVNNFVQTKICRYAVYNPADTDMNLSFIVCASSQDYVSNPSFVYFRSEVVATPNVQYDVLATLEVENQTGDTLNTYLQVLRYNGATAVNFLYESTGMAFSYIAVDNTSGYAPTAGTTFYLNPKLRNNSEVNPFTIENAVDGTTIASVWTNFKGGSNDGWITDSDGNKMLRVPAGCTLNIKLNPFAQFLSTPNSALTMEFDVRTGNVTNEDDPILQLCETVGQNIIGLRMRPMVGTMTTSSHTAEPTSDFRWQEDERTHIAVNIHNAVAPNAQQDGLTSDGTVPTGTLALVRILINGDIEREFTFNTSSTTEFCTGLLSNGGFIIGQEGADIDIYGLRIFASQQLSARQVNQDRIAAEPSAEKKERLKRENDIFDGNKVDVEKVKGIGKNVLIWHGQEVWHGASSSQLGWWEVYRYDDNGQYIPELSGTICRDTASLSSKGQGTTAKTYYYWNEQTNQKDVTATIQVLLADLHESISYTIDLENSKVYLIGGNLGKDFPVNETAKAYPLITIDGAQGVEVPDGWIDGNGKYRGLGYMVTLGLPLAQKTVLKINYASSMQSHIIGVNKLYNDLHTLYCGKNALQALTDGAVVAKHLEPFLFFTQASDSASPVYRGAGAWGAGKFDKPSWGYTKSAFPLYAMIEGADNNKELTDMRVPFDDTVHTGDTYPKVFYNPEEEAWYYRTESGLQNAQKSLDFDGGKTVDYAVGDLDATHLWAGEYPHPDIVTYLRSTINFLFLHNPRIKPFIASGGTLGSFSDFTQSQSATDYGNKYWCSDYKLYRYDYADHAWVPAGLWRGSSYDEVLLRDSTAEQGTLAYETYTAWNALTNNEKADIEGAVNDAFIKGIVKHAKDNIGTYFVVNSLKFHYAFVNHFIAGSDNNSKNTYYTLVPTAGSLGSWTNWKFELGQDDVDTVLATDNSGLQTKPYYIDRMHPYAEDDIYETDALYEGMNNVLFNLCEEMWEGTLELSDTLRSIFASMSSLTGGTGSEESDAMNGVWKSLNRYIFDVQRYIPTMAYNEQARIRYEFPKLMNYTSDQRQVDPIEQSMGSQLQAELQWMKRRLVYMASYAAFGEFAPRTGGGSGTGLTDLDQSFAMVMAALPNSTTQTSVYKFRLVPHQWMYPTAALAQTGINPHVRVAPNAANMPDGYYEMTISPTGRSDDGITIYAINYYRSIGNIGDNCFNPSGKITLNGKRLTSFTVEPTTYYSTTIGGGSITAQAWQALSDEGKAAYLPAFRCNGIEIGTATRLGRVSFSGCPSVGGGAVDFNTLIRVASIDMRYTNILSLAIPQSPTLTTLRLGSMMNAVVVQNCAMLSTLTIQGYDSITQFVVTGSPLLGQSLRSHVLSLRSAGVALSLLRLYGIDWMAQPVDADVIRWLISVGDGGVCDLKGDITVVSGTFGIIYYEDVDALIRRYGDIRSSSNDLYISFGGTAITTNAMSIAGKKYINTDSTSQAYDLDINQCYDGLSLLVASGNDVAVAVDGNGNTVPDVVWELTNDTTGVYAEFPDPYSPVLHLVQVGDAVSGITLNVRATLTNTSNETRVVEKIIGLWNRIPQVGDYAWADGQFDNTNDASKKCVGMVIGSKQRSDGSAYDILVLSAANPSFPTSSVTGGMESSWGLYPDATNGISDANTDGEYDDDVLEAVRLAVQGWTKPAGIDYTTSNTFKTDIFDTPLANLTGNEYIRKDAAAVTAAGGGIAMQDESAVDNNGYAAYSQAYMNNMDNEAENAVLQSYANAVLVATLSALGITQEQFPDGCTTEGIPTTTQALHDLADIIVQKVTDNNVTYPANYRQLLFMAARRCWCWSPADISGALIGETDLHESYRRGKWMLPTSGWMARIFNFMANSRAEYNVSSAPSSTYAEQSEGGTMPNVSLESQKPLFANALARGREIPISSGSPHWCCSESYRGYARLVYFASGNAYSYNKYTGLVVRPVAAFTFVP